MLAAVLLAALLQSPPAPSPPAGGTSPADEAERAFRAEITTERLPFDPVNVTRKRLASAADAEQRQVVTADTTVIGVTLGGESRAYPIEIVGGVESLNDVLGGTPILVSWCVRCQAAIVYERKVGEQLLTFGSQRALYRGSAVLYDVETGSLWSQPMGRAGAGPMRERSLVPVASQLRPWSGWRAEHPDTSVLVGPPPRRFQRSSFYVWDPKAALRLAIVVRDGAAARLYPLASLSGDAVLFRDEVAGRPVLVVFSPARQLLSAFRREIDGKPIELELETPEAPQDAGSPASPPLLPLLLKEKGGERRWRADTGAAVTVTGPAPAGDPPSASPAPPAPALEHLVAYPLSRARFTDFFPDGTVYSADAARDARPPKRE